MQTCRVSSCLSLYSTALFFPLLVSCLAMNLRVSGLFCFPLPFSAMAPLLSPHVALTDNGGAKHGVLIHTGDFFPNGK